MTSADVRFDPVAHVYTLPDGRRLPSVTQILRETGVSTDFESLRAMGGRVAETIDHKRDIGTALHADAHAYDDGDLIWESVHPDVLPYLEAWRSFREHKQLRPHVRERLIYHPTLGYAGTADGVFVTPSLKTVLIDIKTGDPEDSACRFQTAAYQLAFELEHGPIVQERWAVQLMPHLSGLPFRVTKYDQFSDFNVWKSIVVTFYAQAARRRAA